MAALTGWGGACPRLSAGTAANVVGTDFVARPVPNPETWFRVDPGATIVFYARTNTGHLVV